MRKLITRYKSYTARNLNGCGGFEDLKRSTSLQYSVINFLQGWKLKGTRDNSFLLNLKKKTNRRRLSDVTSKIVNPVVTPTSFEININYTSWAIRAVKTKNRFLLLSFERFWFFWNNCSLYSANWTKIKYCRYSRSYRQNVNFSFRSILVLTKASLN